MIIGAGIGGLATANLLAKAGYKVAVYEKNSIPGGRTGKLKVDGFTFDTGPSWYLMPSVFDHYFSLFGKNASKELKLTKLRPAYKVFFENYSPITITGNRTTDEATFESLEKGSGRQLRRYVNKGNSIYKLALKHFLYTNFSSFRDFINTEVMRNALIMLLLAFMPIDKYVRRFVSDKRLMQILEYPMVFLGSSPFTAPAIYSLMSALDFEEGVYYPKKGIYSIIEQLIVIGNEYGVTYHYNSAAKRIITNGGQASGIELTDGTIVQGDIVISNADLHHTETELLTTQHQSYPQAYWQKREAGPSALLMYLGVVGEIPQLEHHNLYFVDDWEENFTSIFKSKTIPFPASFYVCKPSASDAYVAPKGAENLFVLVPLPSNTPLDTDLLEELGNKFLSYIEKKLGIKNLEERIVVKEFVGPNGFKSKFNAWEGSALGPSHVLKQSAMFRTPNKSKKLANLYYVGGFTTPGIGLPMCLIGAELVYKRLIGDKRGGPVKNIIRISHD